MNLARETDERSTVKAVNHGRGRGRGKGRGCGRSTGRSRSTGRGEGRGCGRSTVRGRGRGRSRGRGRGRTGNQGRESATNDNEEQENTANEQWEETNWEPQNIPFTGIPGPAAAAADLEEDDPMKFFQLFMDDNIIEHIVQQTNLYAEQSIQCQQEQDKQQPHSRSRAWKPVTLVELKKFFGLLFLTGIIRKPTLQSYWSTDELISTPMFAKVMSRNRFELILSYLHFNNNEQRESDLEDRLFKVRPVLAHFLQKFREMYIPNQNISIDEGMLSWRGRLGFRVYNPKKPVKYGIKSYVLTDSKNSYCWNLKPYCGVGATLEETILILLDNLVNQGYKLFMDNFYNSVGLSKKLLQLKTHTCGTLRKDRGEPAVINDACMGNMEIRNVESRNKDNIICLAWRDKRVVRMISTIGEDKMVEVRVKQRGHPDGVLKSKPHCIVLYNESMGGVDKMDQCNNVLPAPKLPLHELLYMILRVGLMET